MNRPIVIVGGGAAGLATAIFTRRANPAVPVWVLDGAARLGAKILVSGGSRCNVTNSVVTERDYWGGKRTIVRRVLSRLPVRRTIEFFEELGVRLKEEPTGKLFPVTDRSRDVLDSLLAAARALDVRIVPSSRVQHIEPGAAGFTVRTTASDVHARAVVMATGGLSLPKSGSDGHGLAMAKHLGHAIVPTTPALAPLTLAGGFHVRLSGVAQDVELALRTSDADGPDQSPGPVSTTISGPMLWTHFGISGPAALDMSRHWLRARLDERRPTLELRLAPGETFESLDAHLASEIRQRPRSNVRGWLERRLPASVATAILETLAIDPGATLAHLPRERRRAFAHALNAYPLDVTGSRGYNFAEATAGGVSLDEVDPSTMESRCRRGIYLVGEMLDVDGRLGGFNFQWAWSSARVAADALARMKG